MNADISVVICVFNGADTLPDCMQSLAQQRFPSERFEVIVVDDGSTDGSGDLAASAGARVVRGPHRGLAAARNIGWRAACAEWVAFTDDDCGPTRQWLDLLWRAVHATSNGERVLGAAGRLIGFPSEAPASRYVDLTGGFNTERHLLHPQFPYAPMGNIMYRREALDMVGGLDERYTDYEACDLHTRLRQRYRGAFVYEPRALVFHRHYSTWRGFYAQQRRYGRGLAQFMRHYRQGVHWSVWREARAWAGVAASAATALIPGRDEQVLLRRGDFVKRLGLRMGFARTYWSRAERRRWAGSR